MLASSSGTLVCLDADDTVTAGKEVGVSMTFNMDYTTCDPLLLCCIRVLLY
jgi:hypothetical protein